MDWIDINNNPPTSGSRIWAKDQRGNAVLGTCNISASGACSLASDTPGVTILNVQFWVSCEYLKNNIASILEVPPFLLNT